MYIYIYILYIINRLEIHLRYFRTNAIISLKREFDSEILLNKK